MMLPESRLDKRQIEVAEDAWEDARGRLALGRREFRTKLPTGRPGSNRGAGNYVGWLTWTPLSSWWIKKRGEQWHAFEKRHGDLGRDAVFCLARKRSGLTLAEICRRLGRVEYKTVGKAVQRFEGSLLSDRARRRFVQQCLDELSLVKT